MPDLIVMLDQPTNDTSKTRELPFNGPVTSMVRSSTTAARPVTVIPGTMVFDSTLGKPIWWDGVALVWVDATGTPV
jgi:hypothetical protein